MTLTAPEEAATNHMVLLVVFTLGAERFALLATAVSEVVRSVAVAALPKAPPIVEGVINYRGSVVPVVDPRLRFGLPPEPLSLDQHFIVAEAGPRTVALRVSRATDLRRVPAAAIDRAPPVAGMEHVFGIATLPDGLLVIQDLARFLALDEAEQLDAALRDARSPGRRPRRGDSRP